MQHLLTVNKLTSFVFNNRGTKCFKDLSLEDIRLDVSFALISDQCVYNEDENGYINGLIIWDIEEYIPLRICIREALTNSKGILGKLLQQLADKLPPSFVMIAQRRRSKDGLIEYKNPRRIMKLIQQQRT